MLHQAGRKLDLAVSQELFSSHDVDGGTKLLLRTLEGESPRKVLDFGCGYGALGLALKAVDRSIELHMVDRDALALRYSAANAVANELDPVEVYGTLGYDDVVAGDFDLALMNIPAKAGRDAIEHFLIDGRWHVASEGKMAVVAVAVLEPMVSSILDRPGLIDVELKKSNRSYVVFHYRYIEGGESSAESGFERGVYGRGRARFSLEDLDYELGVVHDLPEFDTLSFSTSLAAPLLGGARHRFFQEVVILNPGQGHIPLFIAKVLEPRKIHLVDRDLLGLRVSEANVLGALPSQEIEAVHSVDVPAGAHEAKLWVDLLRPKEPSAASYARLDRFSEAETLVLAGPSTPVTRALAHLDGLGRWKLEGRTKKKGFSAARLERTH